MADSIFFNMILNIGLLILIATVLTKVPVVRHLLLGERTSLGGKLLMAVIFGLVSILSTYTGTSVQGAIVNTRVIGVVSAGLLGGPVVGMGAALIAGIHRYLFDIGGFTAFSCAISTFFEGMLGAFFCRWFRRGKWDSVYIFCLTAVAEIFQMIIILCLARPFADALALVQVIALPMIVLNSIGMVVFIGTFNVVFVEENSELADRMRLAFQIVEQCLPHLKNGLHSREDMEAAATVIRQSSSGCCVLITDTSQIIASSVNEKEKKLLAINEIPAPAKKVLDSKETLRFVDEDKDSPLYTTLKNYVLTAAPLVEMDRAVGTIILITKRSWFTSLSDLSLLKDLAKLFSTQLELSDLEFQKRQRKKAEYLALQSQINPHFLYNALNTISSVCREDSDRARELLRTLATYYRQTLESERYMVNLTTELYHVMNYLELEKARFEEKLQIETEIPDDLDCLVPSFILQPLVENAVHHGADAKGNRFVKIQASENADGILVSVSDHGKGFSKEALDSLYSPDASPKDKGVGLRNVHNRLKNIYGENGGLQIHSSPQGSTVEFLITPNPMVDFLIEEDERRHL